MNIAEWVTRLFLARLLAGAGCILVLVCVGAVDILKHHRRYLRLREDDNALDK